MKPSTARFGLLFLITYLFFILNATSQNTETPPTAPKRASNGNGLVDHLTGDFNYVFVKRLRRFCET